MDRSRSTIVGLGLVALLGAAPARAAPRIEELRDVPDVTTVLAGQVVSPAGVAADDLRGRVTPILLPGIPPGARLGGYERMADGDELLSLDVTVMLPGGVVAGPRDVLRLGNGGYTVLFRGADHGIPEGARIGALAGDPGQLLFSFDVSIALPGLAPGQIAGPRDVVRFDGASFASVFSGDAAGVPPGLSIDGLQALEPAGSLLVSFDGAGAIGDVPFFDRNAILAFDARVARWELAFDGTASPAAWPDGSNLRDFGASLDSDGDGVPDALDDCILVADPDQRDTNGDGYGNVCDADLNDDGVVNFADLASLKEAFFGPGPDADLDGDGRVNFSDLARMRVGFFAPPGPSGLACAGASPCPHTGTAGAR